MLKITGMSGKKVEDEKILVDDNNKLTFHGWIVVGIGLLADVGLITLAILIYKMIRKIKNVFRM